MIYTIESDDEVEPDITSDEESTIESQGKNKHSTKNDVEFSFQLYFDDGEFQSKPVKAKKNKLNKKISVNEESEDHVRAMPHSEERLQRARQKLKKKKQTDSNTEDLIQDTADIESNDDDNDNEEEEDDDEDERSEEDGEDPTYSGMNAQEEAEYFDSVINTSQSDTTRIGGTMNGSSSSNNSNNNMMFTELNLSRNILRGVEAAGYVTPTPIQSSVIPLALAGRDIVASAATGSGKTAAFLLPCLERLQYRNRDTATIRILVITPTRELALQIYSVLQKLSTYTDVTSVLICGGSKDLRRQEASLRLQPDIVICTPGRFLDHLRNSASVHVRELDVLILDEVDRLLDLGFQEEVEELVKQCPTNRQTMLFSATLTNKVEDLIKLSLRRPVRVKTSLSPVAIAPRLIQEFIKIKNDDEREAILISLICRSFHDRTIIFCDTKKETYRIYLLLKVLNIPVTQIHGDLTQAQRYAYLEDFRNERAEVLVATDVAARGLDIPGVRTVVNAEMPRNSSTYIHRVGRTARAGSGGRSITLVTDDRRKVVKDMLKSDAALLSGNKEDGSGDNMKGRVLSRSVSTAVIQEYKLKILSHEDELQEVMKQERLDKQLRDAQSEVEKAENMLLHEDEIHARPVRTWYQTETQKQATKELTRKQVREEKAALLQETYKKMNATEKLNYLSIQDDYRVDDKNDSNKGKEHRLSRKKRRRLEALKDIENDRNEENEAINNNDDGENDHDGEGSGSSKKVAIVKKKKVTSGGKNTSKGNNSNEDKKSLAEIGAMREVKKRSRLQLEGKKNKEETKDLMRPRFAVGGLDQDSGFDYLTSSNDGTSKKKLKLMQRKTEAELSYEFDPNKKLRKGGKIGKSSFKSKARYKRR